LGPELPDKKGNQWIRSSLLSTKEAIEMNTDIAYRSFNRQLSIGKSGAVQPDRFFEV